MSFGKATSYPTFDLTIDVLTFVGAVPFGSRPLGVATERSDYDFAIKRSNYEELMQNKVMPTEYDVKDYFFALPASGNNTIVANIRINGGKNIDLLILEHSHDIDTVRKAIEDMKKHPRTKLLKKKKRVKLYEKALIANGFVPKYSWSKLIKKITKSFKGAINGR